MAWAIIFARIEEPVADVFHQSLEILEQAARRARAGGVCLPVALAPSAGLGWAERWGAAALRHKVFVLAQHLRLIRRALPYLSQGKPVLVREFSTVPLWLVAAALKRWRARLFFLVNHNLQWALNQRSERWAFSRLEKMRLRFVFFETLENPAISVWKFDRARHACLRFPVSELPASPLPRRSAGERARIGLAGHYRREKGMIEAVETLMTVPGLERQVVVGLPNPDDFIRDWRARGRNSVPALQNTQRPEAYRAFLASCSVVALNYSARDYAWRPSGVIADCAAARTPVVVPALPLQRHQLEWPTPVGEIFQGLVDLPRAVFQALEKGARNGYDFDAYCRARGLEATAAALDGMWTR